MTSIPDSTHLTPESRARADSAPPTLSAGAESYASSNGFGSVGSESPLNPIRLEAKTLPIIGEEGESGDGVGGGSREGRSGLELPPTVEYKGITRPMSAHVSWGRPPSYI